jgi:hypothetical protein
VILFDAGADKAYIAPYFDALTNARNNKKGTPEYIGNDYAYAKFEGFSLDVTQAQIEAVEDVFGLPANWNDFLQFAKDVGQNDGVQFFSASARITPQQWYEYVTNN